MADYSGRIDVTAAPYGAKCDGMTDDTVAISHAVADAHALRRALYIPAGWGCKYSETIELTAMVPIIGDGRSVSRLIYTGEYDAIHIKPPLGGSDNVGHCIRDVSIQPLHQGGGRYAIHVELVKGAYYAYWNFDRLDTGDFRARALWLNNDAGNVDGFFNGQVSNCLLRNGVLGTMIGDSVQFVDTTIHGHNNVDLSGVPGARLSGIRGGQITTRSGFLILRGADGFRVRDVWMESPDANCLSENTIVLLNTIDTQFSGLTINAGRGAYPVHLFALINASDTIIENSAFITRGSAAHVYGVASTKNTIIRNNTYNGIPPVNTLQGS